MNRINRAKKVLSVFLAIVIAVSSFVMPTVAAQGAVASVSIIINGERVQPTDQEPFIEPVTGRTMVPLRFISEAFGYTVGWDDATRTVTIGGDLAHVIGTNTITRVSTGEVLTFDAPSFIVAETGRTVVPLRFIAEALNATVNWDDATRSVIIWQEGFAPPETDENENDNHESHENHENQSTGINRPNNNTVIHTGGGNSGGGNNGNNNGNNNIPTPEPGSQPYLRVITPFPDGHTGSPFVDIEYIAVPSEGARIEAVYYYLNGVFHNYIYLAENNIRYQHPVGMGTLGNARVFIIPGQNLVEFFVLDTFGRTTNFTIENRPILQIGDFPCYTEIDPQYIIPIVEGGQWFVSNQIYIGLVFPRDHISMSDIMEVVESVDGIIIGSRLGLYLIELPLAGTWDELLALTGSLENEFPHIVDTSWARLISYLSVSSELSLDAELLMHDNEGGDVLGAPFRPINTPARSDQWGLRSANFPLAWTTFGN
jgi:hypothetical protein